jgi:hypothetical protein
MYHTKVELVESSPRHRCCWRLSQAWSLGWMCWYSVEVDETDEKLVSNDDEAMDNDLVSVVKRMKYQF